jgi:hypothetical protein
MRDGTESVTLHPPLIELWIHTLKPLPQDCDLNIKFRSTLLAFNSEYVYCELWCVGRSVVQLTFSNTIDFLVSYIM